MLAPICLFTYNRLFETRQTILALQKNFLAPESDLIIFSDGGKNDASWKQVHAIRDYIKNIVGFKTVRIIESEVNKGLANSIIQGVSLIMEEYGKVIVLEDDLVTSANFLDYMNQCLDKYAENKKVFAISGYSYPLKYSKDYIYDVSFGYRSYSWGWASWKDRWDKIDWEVSDYAEFLKSKSLQKSFNRGGSDLTAMLKKQMTGKIDSWMIRWVYHQFRNDLYDVFPTISKVLNNGFTKTATHTSSCSPLRYLTPLDKSQSRFFSFPMHVSINPVIIKQVQSKISLLRRIKFRLFDVLKLSQFFIDRKLIKMDKINNEPILPISSSDKKVPVLLVIFNRPETTDKVFAAIKQYKPDKLYVASDGPRENKIKEKEIVNSVRKLITENIDWPCELKTLFREKNVGCGYGVSSAISWFFEQEEFGIILEDDCYPSPSFFPYCEELLRRYKDDDRIKMIGGNNFQKGNKRGDTSYFFANYPATWGWATWRRAWKIFDSSIPDAEEAILSGRLNHVFQSKKEKNHWIRSLKMAHRQPDRIWDFQFFYNIWANGGFCITPNKNLVVNLGFFVNSTHYFLNDSTKTKVDNDNLILPLVHPSSIEVNKVADKFTYDHFFSHSLRRGFKLFFENDIISIFRYFKHRFFE